MCFPSPCPTLATLHLSENKLFLSIPTISACWCLSFIFAQAQGSGTTTSKSSDRWTRANSPSSPARELLYKVSSLLRGSHTAGGDVPAEAWSIVTHRATFHHMKALSTEGTQRTSTARSTLKALSHSTQRSLPGILQPGESKGLVESFF